MEYKIITGQNAYEFQNAVNKYIAKGYSCKGSHQVVRTHEQLRYSGMQHKDTVYDYEYSQTMIKIK